MKKVIKTSLKILGWIILGIVTLLLLAALLIQTDFVKKKISSFAEKQANTFINGELTLGEIGGNFFTGINLEDILISQNGDTLGYIQELKASYNLLPLIDGKLDIQSVQVGSPRVFLKQINDSTWNVQQLIKASTDTTTANTSSSNFAIDLAKFRLVDGTIFIDSQDTLIPREINKFAIVFSGAYSADKQSLKMDEFSFNARQPDVSVEKLIFTINRDKESIVLKDFELKTAKNQLQGDGDFAEASDPYGNANFKTAPIALSEFQFILPDLQLPARPVFTLEASLRDEKVKAVIQLEAEDQKFHFDLVSENLYIFLFNPENTEL
ncbi:MAG: AsmA family protein, partial [Bacteroidales bacterium]|nr:AsmA family protein [Bacteroidales bacterium]